MSEPVALEQADEVARFDPSRLEALCDAMGEAQAEAEAAEALHRIRQYLAEFEAVTAADIGRAERKSLTALIKASEKIGMATLGRVARDVRHCVDTGDPIALAATLSRLQRVGDRSIHAVFDLHDVTV